METGNEQGNSTLQKVTESKHHLCNVTLMSWAGEHLCPLERTSASLGSTSGHWTAPLGTEEDFWLMGIYFPGMTVTEENWVQIPKVNHDFEVPWGRVPEHKTIPGNPKNFIFTKSSLPGGPWTWSFSIQRLLREGKTPKLHRDAGIKDKKE